MRSSIIIYSEQGKTDFKLEAEKIAKMLIAECPDWITGYKLNFTRYKNLNLETESDADIGFFCE